MTNMDDFLRAGHFDEHGKPRVCELYAGAAVMARTLQTLGWTAALLAECAAGCVKFLEHTLPLARLARDVKDRPWREWQQAGVLALIVVAGISCQPFSEAEKMRMEEDSRAWDAFLVIDAAVELQAAWVVLENVPNYVLKDKTHTVFTKLANYWIEKGFRLVRILWPQHNRCGGQTYRKGVLVLLIREEIAEAVDLQPIASITFNKSIVESPTSFTLDKTKNWEIYGKLEQRRNGDVLRFSTSVPVVGAVVQVDDSSRRWRVQKRKRDSADLLVTDRRASHWRGAVPISKVRVISCEDSEYRVYTEGDIVSTVRASGEPPDKGAPLIKTQDGIWNCSVADRGSLNDFSGDEMADMEAAGMTEDEIKSMIGNCAPRLLVKQPFQAITDIMMPHCLKWAACSAGSGPDTEVDESEEQPEAARAEEVVQTQKLALMTVLPKEHKVALEDSRTARLLSSGELRTGKILQTTRECLRGELKDELLVPAGSWNDGTAETFLVAHVARHTPPGLSLYSLDDLAGRRVYLLASLAMAKVESHSAGHTTIDQILPMLDSSGKYKVGALAAKALEPPRVCDGVCTWTRVEALTHCRAIEVRAERALEAAAAEASSTDAELGAYLLEWRQQVTVTDLKDVPDDLLEQMPVFDDHKLLMQSFSHTSIIPNTEAVQPPVNPQPSHHPETTAGLFKPGCGVLPQRDEAEEEMVRFFQLMWDGAVPDQKRRYGGMSAWLKGHNGQCGTSLVTSQPLWTSQ